MKILNFGSLNIDYVYSVHHFVRPGETLAASKREIFAGGKGLNQSVALARALGNDNDIRIYHAGGIGRTEGQFLKTTLSDAGVNTDYIKEYDEPSGHTVIQVDSSGQNSIIIYNGANTLQNPEFIRSVFSHFSAGDYLVLQNEVNNVDSMIETAYEKHMRIFLNPSPYDSRIAQLPLHHVSCFLINEVEAADMTGISAAAPDILLSTLKRKFPAADIVLTLGNKGVLYSCSSGIYSHGIYQVPVVDTTGAGDTFTGYFISCLAKKLPVPELLRRASIASSIAVSRKGASSSIPELAEVLASKFIPTK